jgi:hypothetical protein
MPPTLDFLNAIFASDLANPIPIFVNDIQLTCTADVVEQHSGGIYTCGLTDGGVAFVFSFYEGSASGAVHNPRVPPTAVLYKDGNSIECWAFECLEKKEDVLRLSLALGMTAIDERVPVPNTNGWSLEHVDPNAFTTLATMNAAYVTDNDPEGGKPVEEDATEEPEVEHNAELVEEIVQIADPTGKPVNITVETYGDARVLAPYNEDDCLQPFTFTLGVKTDSKNWKPDTKPLGAFIANLCKHREGEKNGPAFVLGEMVPGQRLKNSVKSLTGIGLDIDTGTPSRVVDAALTKLGCLAVRYTTHSHAKSSTTFKKDKVIKYAGDEDIDDEMIRSFLLKSEEWDQGIVDSATYGGTDHTDKGIIVTVHHNAMPKHRIVIPLAVPFEIAKEGKTQKEAQDKWARHRNGPDGADFG